MLQPIPYTPTMRTEISTCSIGYLPPFVLRGKGLPNLNTASTLPKTALLTLKDKRYKKQENGRPVNFLQDTYGKCCTDDR